MDEGHWIIVLSNWNNAQNLTKTIKRAIKNKQVQNATIEFLMLAWIFNEFFVVFFPIWMRERRLEYGLYCDNKFFWEKNKSIVNILKENENWGLNKKEDFWMMIHFEKMNFCCIKWFHFDFNWLLAFKGADSSNCFRVKSKIYRLNKMSWPDWSIF